MLRGELGEQAGVERLGEARVGDRDVEPALGEQVRGAEADPDAGAVADDGDALALAQDLPVPIWIRSGLAGIGTPSASPRG